MRVSSLQLSLSTRPSRDVGTQPPDQPRMCGRNIYSFWGSLYFQIPVSLLNNPLVQLPTNSLTTTGWQGWGPSILYQVCSVDWKLYWSEMFVLVSKPRQCPLREPIALLTWRGGKSPEQGNTTNSHILTRRAKVFHEQSQWTICIWSISRGLTWPIGCFVVFCFLFGWCLFLQCDLTSQFLEGSSNHCSLSLLGVLATVAFDGVVIRLPTRSLRHSPPHFMEAMLEDWS